LLSGCESGEQNSKDQNLIWSSAGCVGCDYDQIMDTSIGRKNDEGRSI